MVPVCDEFVTLLEKYMNRYPKKFLDKFPEFSVEKLNNGVFVKSDFKKPDSSSLENLNSNQEERSREEVINWMKTYLDYKTLVFIGW